jgi:hypothetical protein
MDSTHYSNDCSCDDCLSVRRAKFYANRPEQLAAYEARKAAAKQVRLAAEKAQAEYAARFRAATREDFFACVDVPAGMRCVVIDRNGSHVTFAVAADASPRGVEWILQNEMAQATDGAFVCKLVSYESDEAMAARGKVAA